MHGYPRHFPCMSRGRRREAGYNLPERAEFNPLCRELYEHLHSVDPSIDRADSCLVSSRWIALDQGLGGTHFQ